MRYVTERDVRDLAERYHLTVDETELGSVTDVVNQKLDDLDAVYDVPVQTNGYDGNRHWSVPEENPHRALAVECTVSPATPNSGELSGMSVGLKDIIAVAGVPMGCGSGVMEGYIPDFDATVVDRLRNAGATITAKTNLDEFAGDGKGRSYIGQMTNPHDDSHSPGGSSGGSAIAVATDLVDVALGTDTGGSIRLPSSFCGIVGLKPTYGLVSIFGIVENTYSCDHVGPMSKSVEDATTVMGPLAGTDERDAVNLAVRGLDEFREPDFSRSLSERRPLSEVTIGVIEEGLGEGNSSETVRDDIVERTEAVVDLLADEGATIRRQSIEQFEAAQVVKYCLSLPELAAHWRVGGAPYRRGLGHIEESYQISLGRLGRAASGELSEHYRGRLLAGAQVIEAHHGRYYARAVAARGTIEEQFSEPFDDVDALLFPTGPTLAHSLEDVESSVTSTARNTMPANVTGQPAISLPAGMIDGLPVGVQLMGERFHDDELLAVADSVESVIQTQY